MHRQVAFAWAECLGPAKGLRTLQQLDLLDRAVKHGVHAGKFDFAHALAQAAGDGHLAAWAHQQHALALQDQGSHLQLENKSCWIICSTERRAWECSCGPS